MSASAPTPLEQPCATATERRMLTIGLPLSADPSERRFPLTPEGASRLVERGYVIRMEAGAAEAIHYADAAYERAGVEVTARPEALGCDIVISLAPLPVADARRMRRGAMLLTLLESACASPMALAELLRRHAITVALDMVEDAAGHTPFADILAEIDGRASVAIASSLLANPLRGKGILLGGVAGIVPCETMIVGSGIAACAAARSAIGLGSIVRMFDDDIYSLRRAQQELGPWLITSAPHPRTIDTALRTADVIVVTPTASPFSFGTDSVTMMKKGVITFDITGRHDKCAFPSMLAVDLADAAAVDAAALASGRICFVHAGSAVARTAAMALGNTLATFFDSLDAPESPSGALRLPRGMQKATLTFFGKAVNPRVAEALGVRPVDISIYLSLS